MQSAKIIVQVWKLIKYCRKIELKKLGSVKKKSRKNFRNPAWLFKHFLKDLTIRSYRIRITNSFWTGELCLKSWNSARNVVEKCMKKKFFKWHLISEIRRRRMFYIMFKFALANSIEREKYSLSRQMIIMIITRYVLISQKSIQQFFLICSSTYLL